jgi:hypothetical protein
MRKEWERQAKDGAKALAQMRFAKELAATGTRIFEATDEQLDAIVRAIKALR